MDILGLLGILLGILTIILFIIKKFNIIVAAPIATIVVLLFNDVPILETLFGKENSYMTSLAGFIAANFAISYSVQYWRNTWIKAGQRFQLPIKYCL